MTSPETEPLNPSNEESPDLIADELEHVLRQYSDSLAQKPIEEVTPEELTAFGITKSIGPNGEIIFRHASSPDTGQALDEMHVGRVATYRMELSPADLEAQRRAAEHAATDFKNRSDAGEVGHLPPREDL